MKGPTIEEQKQLVRQWEETGRELDRMRRQALRGLEYKWEDVVALLDLGDQADLPPRTTSGLVEMQRLFMMGFDGRRREDASARKEAAAPKADGPAER